MSLAPTPHVRTQPTRSTAALSDAPYAQGSLAPGAAGGEAQLRFNKTDWSNFGEADDCSRVP